MMYDQSNNFKVSEVKEEWPNASWDMLMQEINCIKVNLRREFYNFVKINMGFDNYII